MLMDIDLQTVKPHHHQSGTFQQSGAPTSLPEDAAALRYFFSSFRMLFEDMNLAVAQFMYCINVKQPDFQLIGHSYSTFPLYLCLYP